ncbi:MULTISPECIES: PspC domain-containing protein [Alteribacter]|uniref:PspC domain-containing protein n=1 Tax=Alteribacter keqinensis TaxID=2483800 RepID=A0A3M7TPG6_9BACI|nr:MULTISPECIES: PspC domain-containing protein [Alteribacter]MBM7096892.1 PspC domain-containing protein [Alteribacter salitolerans]RNA67524.1 PspC domain-containing protein [Alteribacter keqinensis]
MKRLYRTEHDRKISGVCGGIAAYFNVDATLIRLLAIIALIFGNVATLLAYIIGVFVIPSESDVNR